MASGRRDYTWGFLNEATSEGRYSETYNEWFIGSIDPGVTLSLLEYAAPAGYRFALGRIEVCSYSRIRNVIIFAIGTEDIFSTLFDTNYSFIVSDKNPLYVSEGQILAIRCSNQDEIAYIFSGLITGVLEQVT